MNPGTVQLPEYRQIVDTTLNWAEEILAWHNAGRRSLIESRPALRKRSGLVTREQGGQMARFRISAVSWHCVVNMRIPSVRFTGSPTHARQTVGFRGDSPVVVGSFRRHKSIYP